MESGGLYDGAENYGHGMFGENGNDSSGESEYDADEHMTKLGSGMFNENGSSDEDGDRVLKPANALIADPDFDFSM